MNKRLTLPASGILALAYGLTGTQAGAQSLTSKTAQEYYLMMGTYAPSDSNGIFVYRFNAANGTSSLVSTVSGIENPSFITMGPDGRCLYAVSETHGGEGGQVYAYAFDRGTGKLRFLNKQLSGGDDPCNIITDPTGKWLFISNYTSGSLSVFPIEKDGSLGMRNQHIQHVGHSIKKQQQSAHVHCVIPSPGNRDVFVTDLGMDRVFTYELNQRTGQLTPGSPAYTAVAKGSGPRHMIFSPNGKFLYLISEIGGTISVFSYQPGKLTEVQTRSNIPEDFRGRIWAADIHISPDGRFLYASYRDDLNDIAVYGIDRKTGRLSFRERVKSGGKTPRNFAISPDGKYLLAGHQNSGAITEFKRNMKTGALTPTGTTIGVPHAVCLKMYPVH